MMGRKSDTYFLWTGIGILALVLMFAHAAFRQDKDVSIIEEKHQLVRSLGLTDLCLFTEARYTRNPVMADLNTPFQDYPMSFEHFPSASLLAVPPHLARPKAKSKAKAKAKAEELASALALASNAERLP